MANKPAVKRPQQYKSLKEKGVPPHIAKKIAGPRKTKRA